ncbi:hypothetical protein G6710_06260 [Polynucleobacter paneuropaeus]|nr:hypothetical protein [Polynucleobacter paneuropaeus]
MKNNLSEITICAVDCVNSELSSKAIDNSLSECSFGDAVLFTDSPLINDINKRHIKIDKINGKNDYSKFLLKDLCKYVQTSHVLIIQWDGYVLDGSQWNDDFLNYDYIGAPWHWHKDGMNVGNGGFSLRSKKLLETMSMLDFPFIQDMNEDDQICRLYRSKLVSDYSIRFPSEQLANTFSYERSLPNQPTFGFHGLFNMWRHLSDNELIEMAEKLNPYVFHSIEYFELLLQCFVMRKFKPLKFLYKRSKDNCDSVETMCQISKLTNDHNLINLFFATCNKL